MKIGVLLQYYNFRNDLRNLVDDLLEHHQIVLFVKNEEKNNYTDKVLKNADIVNISSAKRSFKNRLVNGFYSIFGNRPKSRYNSLQWTRRRFGSSSKTMSNYKELLIAWVGYVMPDLIQFDYYLEMLNYNSTDLKGADCVLSFTDVNDVYFAAQIKQQNIPWFSYLYSWDHPAKYTKFSQNYIHYLVWNNEATKDLAYQHKVKLENISVVGSTQLGLIYTYLKTSKPSLSNNDNKRYLYFASSAGYVKAAKQEVDYVKHLAQRMSVILPNYTLLFRPYPRNSEISVYKPIEQLSNIKFDNPNKSNSKYQFTNNDIFEKFRKITCSEAVIHCGSTFGMESCYFHTPSILLAYKNFDFKKSIKKRDRIQNFLRQYHIKKYLLKTNFINVVENPEDIDDILLKIHKKSDSLMKYNKMVMKYTVLISGKKVVNNIIKKISELT